MENRDFLKLCLAIVTDLALSDKLDAGYTIETIAGTNDSSGYTGDSSTATSAKLSSPAGFCFDGSGNLYIADSGNNVIRMVYNSGTVFDSSSYTKGDIYTIAGNGTASYSGNNVVATSAELRSPSGVYADSSGNLYIADTTNNRVRMVTIVAPSLAALPTPKGTSIPLLEGMVLLAVGNLDI